MNKTARNLSIVILLIISVTVNAALDSLKYAIIIEDNVRKQSELIDEYLSRIREENLDSAIVLSSDLYEISKKINSIEGQTKAAFRLGMYTSNKFEYKTALKWYHWGLDLAQKNNDSLYILAGYRSIGTMHQGLNNFDSLSYYSGKAIAMAQRCNNYYELGAIYNDLANSHLDRLENDSAIFDYLKAIDFFEKINDEEAKAIALGNLGILFISEKDYLGAKKNILEALSVNKRIQNLQELSNNYNNLGIIYKELNKPDSAMLYYEKSIEINNRQKDMGSNAIAYNNMGNLATQMGSYKLAEYYYLKSQNLCDSLDIAVGSAYNYNGLGNLYIETGDYQAAIQYLNLSIEIAEDLGLIKFVLGGNEELYIAYKAIGDYKEALTKFETYHAINDSVRNQEKFETIEKYKQLFESEQKENEILQNKIRYREKAKEARQNKRRSQLILLLLILSTFILAFTIVVYIRLQMNHKKIKFQASVIQDNNIQLKKNEKKIKAQTTKLKNQNKQLNELTEFRQNIINTMVHDLKSPLNSVIGLSALKPNAENQKHIHYAGINMLNLVSNILDVQKQEEAGLKTEIEPVNLIEIIDISAKEISLELNLKEQELDIQIEKPIINADKKLLRRIFVNLLSNSIKYSPRKSKIKIISVRDEEEKSTIIQVIDKGSGIDPKHIDKLFKKYNNFNPKDIGMSYSTGIGLSFCKIAVEAMHGKISITSEKGQGSNVRISIPDKPENKQK